MKTIFHLFFSALLASAAFSAAHAQTVQAAAEFTQAEVRKVDKDNKKITLRHGEIRNLDMPAMTMVFQVDDASVLDRLKPGDRVQFKGTHEGGKYTATEIQPVQ